MARWGNRKKKNCERPVRKILLHNLLAGPGVTDISPDSNLWHVRNYEPVAEKVYVLQLASQIDKRKVIRKGKTIVIAMGTGSSAKDIFLSPFKMFKMVRRIKPEVTVTYEQVFLFWTLLFTRMFQNSVNIMIPIALPSKIYEITKRSLSGRLPICFEKIFRKLSFLVVTNIVTTKNLGDYKKWLLNDPIGKKKTLVFDKLPEEVPSFNFVSGMNTERLVPTSLSPTYNLLVVSRLHPEKLIDHAILALAELIKKDKRYRLSIIGDGDELENLKAIAEKEGVTNFVKFEGYRNTSEIIEQYKSTHVFVSPYTGGALREAALLKLPIVAYNTDWLKDDLKPDEEYAAVEFMNYRQMAEQIELVIINPEFAAMLVRNMSVKAQQLWTPIGLDKEFEKFLKIK
jgi:glycosyltransferase involved in cell wall biosynthesis